MQMLSLLAFFGVTTLFCIGDGLGPHTPCPCGNNSTTASASGCLNSFSTTAGATLRATGIPSISTDSVVLHAGGLPVASTLFFQGTTGQNSGNGSPFGDGLRCAGGSIIRLGTSTSMGAPGSATASYPGTGDPSITVKGLVTSPSTRDYQEWYRNVAAFCTPSGFNLSNGFEITWTP